MASIQRQKTQNGTYYYLAEKIGGKVIKTYLGTKPPIAKSRGWTGLSPEIVEWLKKRAQLKTKPVKLEPSQNGKYRTIVIDPPWAFDNSGLNQSAAQQYEVLKEERISNYTDETGRQIKQLAKQKGSILLPISGAKIFCCCNVTGGEL